MEPVAALRKRLQRVCHETLAWLILFSLALLREFIFEEASSLSYVLLIWNLLCAGSKMLRE